MIKTLTKLLDDKTAYIDKIEERIEELENSVHTIKSRRINNAKEQEQVHMQECIDNDINEERMLNMAHHIGSAKR